MDVNNMTKRATDGTKETTQADRQHQESQILGDQAVALAEFAETALVAAERWDRKTAGQEFRTRR